MLDGGNGISEIKRAIGLVNGNREINDDTHFDESDMNDPAETVHCPECGAIGYPDDKFCVGCGSPMRNTCSKCNAIIRQPVAWFCPQCGEALSGSRTTEGE